MGSTFGLATTGLKEMAIKVIQYLLGFLGIFAISMIMYGGYLWMVSGGNPKKIEKAKKVLISALIGLVIILASFAIIKLLTHYLGGGSERTNPTPENGGQGALGAGIIESVYPAPGQRDVARNTNIAVTFKEEIDPTSFIDDTNGNGTFGDCAGAVCDTVSTDASGVPNVIIAKMGELSTGPYVMPVAVYTNDNKTFVFNPDPLLGNSSNNTWYSVRLTNNILKADGTPAFGAFAGFDWSFEIGTFIDTTPPYITRVFPVAGGTYAKNVVIQIQFSEAIDPTSITNTNILVDDSTAPPSVAGTLYISNQYRTVEFLGAPCGINSCNETIYCLPGNENIQVTVKAPPIGPEPPLALGPPFAGIVDMVGNSFDGNHNGKPEGPGVDDYVWAFKTSNNIEISPPSIESVSPGVNAEGASLTPSVDVTFSEQMMYSSLRTTTIGIKSPVLGYWITDDDMSLPPPVKTIAHINHFKFNVKTQYRPEVNSKAKDMYQNCFYPSAGPGCVVPPPAGQNYCCDGIWSAGPCP